MKKDLKAFTMAEILISLTIIGIVAAITLPALMTNINEKAWNAQRKALHARLSQAIGTMDKLNGYDDALDFVNNALSNSISLTSVCNESKLSQCGISETFVRMDGSAYNRNDAINNSTLQDVAGIRTVNGESILVGYHSGCTEPIGDVSLFKSPVCVNFIYDLNGTKGPNAYGKDVGFITALYPTNSVVVAPMPAYIGSQTLTYDDTEDAMFAYDRDTRLPSKNELISLGINIGGLTEDFFHIYWSGTVNPDDSSQVYAFDNGRVPRLISSRKGEAFMTIGITNSGSAPKSFNASIALTADNEAAAGEVAGCSGVPESDKCTCGNDGNWQCPTR